MNFKYTKILINFFLLVFSLKVMSDNEGTKKIGNFEKWNVQCLRFPKMGLFVLQFKKLQKIWRFEVREFANFGKEIRPQKY